jgi:hypothetical protein
VSVHLSALPCLSAWMDLGVGPVTKPRFEALSFRRAASQIARAPLPEQRLIHTVLKVLRTCRWRYLSWYVLQAFMSFRRFLLISRAYATTPSMEHEAYVPPGQWQLHLTLLSGTHRVSETRASCLRVLLCAFAICGGSTDRKAHNRTQQRRVHRPIPWISFGSGNRVRRIRTSSFFSVPTGLIRSKILPESTRTFLEVQLLGSFLSYRQLW